MTAEPADLDQTTLTVEIEAVRWRAPDGGFAVIAGVSDDGESVTVTGALGHVHEGESVTVAGGWRRHNQHGWQFLAQQVRVLAPVSDRAIIAYLKGVKHVGDRGARWLYEAHGEEVLQVVDADPRARLSEVPGIGKAKLGAAVKSWQRQGEQRAVRLFLEEHGVPAAVAARIYRHFGGGSIERLQADPYALTEVPGIGFKTADALAQALGTPPDSPGRLDAGLIHALTLAEDDGHCHLPRAELLERARTLLGADPDDRLDELLARGRLTADGGRVATPEMDGIERALARRVRELLDADPAFTLPDLERPDGDTAPTDVQWGAVTAALERRLTILTGLPGTGKTQTMRALVDVLLASKRKVRLCAPTGKAARRLAETTGAEATTIHRLLGWLPEENSFEHDAEDPITGVDLLVVDEASMLSVRLAHALLDAVGPATHVLLVGDVDQLAPVGPGRVLEDLIDSGAVPVTRLTEIFRQAARSMIVRAAHAINAGDPPPTTPRADDLHDFFLIASPTPFEEIVALAAERLPRHYDLQPVGDVQVLAPMHKGPVGIDAFNDALRARLNPDGAAIPGTPFRLGDRVIQSKNDHEHELMNGELGVLVHHDSEREAVIFAGDDGRTIRLPISDTETLRLAYAISVHKAQGSQTAAIVMPLSRAHSVMLTRNLLYTAITRATKLVVLVGDPSALSFALTRVDARRRHTRLRELVSG
ncbi:MAG TPA: ATP-dependent RecD-like DNA helicase [Solirubrobacteraceae bacterium]